jgi:hypothetical protein
MQTQPTDRFRNQAETRRKASSALARAFGLWRTGLPLSFTVGVALGPAVGGVQAASEAT